ncbi:MAG: tyrosine-type recombinase/integrase [Terrimicrobiaceae bacterium]|nr:tyrosine-type recombinase/integrase [Terrimicrobiaceae bacterium]
MSSQAAFEKVGECLYRNPTSGTYYAITKVRGKQIKKSLKTDNLPEARRKLKDHRTNVTRIDHKAARNTLAHYAEVMLGAAKGKADTFSKNKARIVDLIKTKWPGGSNIPISDVKASGVRLFMQKAGAGRGWSYYNFILGIVKTCFTMALDDRAILEIPGERDRKRGEKDDTCWARRKINKPVRLTPSMDQFRAIVASIRSQQFAGTREETADFVEAQGCLGLGQAELANLRWQSVDLKSKTIAILRIKPNEPFEIPIYPQARALIERRKEITGGAPADRVFSILDAKVAVSAACRRLKFPQFSQRSFRRMFVTTALENGVNVKTIAELQGHQDGGKLILDTYSHVIGRAGKQNAAAIIGKAFGTAKGAV